MKTKTTTIVRTSVKAAAIAGLLVWFANSAPGALSVTTTANANTLANAIMGGGVTLNSASYSGAAVAAGTFSGGNTASLGFNTGIVLTTGAASTAGSGVNSSGSFTTQNGGGAYAPLTTLSGQGSTFDSARLIMNFTISATDPGNLFFNFVFASEEYNEYSASQFNDVFAFFLDGTAVGDNIGLVNGVKVSVNTVNASVNSAFYRNNRPGETLNNPGAPGPYAIEYDGLTTVLTASALGLAPGQHQIILAIADTSDAAWDSAVFIQGGTFSTEYNPVPEPSTYVAGALLLLPFGASTLRILRKNRKA